MATVDLEVASVGTSGRSMRHGTRRRSVLFLSNSTSAGSTARILQSWLRDEKDSGLRGHIVARDGSHLLGWARESGVNALADPMPWPNRLAPWSVLWHALRVARWAKRAGVEIIHCNEHDVYPFAQVLRRFLPVPVVCHVRYRLQREFAEWAFRGTRRPDVLLWTSFQQQADSADAVAGMVPEERQHVLRLGVDLADISRYAGAGRELRREWGIRADEVLIGLPSPLRPRKRVEDFVTVVQRVAERHPQVVGVIAGQEIPGDEEYRARIERLVASSGLGRRLRWVGYLSPIEPFHHACDISVSTSEYETFGNSVCEAMACGKPVAAYRGGSVEEVVGETGLVVETGERDALTEAVARLVTDESLRLTLGQRARDRVASEFSPANSRCQLEGIYTDLLPKGDRR